MVLLARDIMQADLLFLDGSMTAGDAAQAMTSRHVGCAIVTEGGEPTGIVTEWDFLSKILGAARDATSVPLRAVASTPLISADAATPTEDIISIMDQRSIRRMVLTDHGKIVGLVTAREVLHAFQHYMDRVSADISRMHTTTP